MLISSLLVFVTIFVLYTAPATDEQAAGGKPVPEDELANDYDAAFVAAYWARRPNAVAARSLRVGMAAARVGYGVFIDKLLNRWGAIRQEACSAHAMPVHACATACLHVE